MSEVLTIEQTWSLFEKMVFQRCHSFRNSTGFDFDDLLGESKLTFVKVYNKHFKTRRKSRKKSIEEFGKMLYVSINNRLCDYVKKNKHFIELPECYEDICFFQFSRMLDFYSSLSEESKIVVNIILESKEILNRTDVSKHLREKGYTYPTIWKCIKEIKQVLKNL